MLFSLIIPTCKRPAALKMCLDAIFLSDYPVENYEVIIIIDGECKPSMELTQDYQTRHKNLVVYNQLPQRGPAAARNKGIDLSKGVVVGFTDDDCIVDAQWIRKMTETHLSNPDIAAVGGDTYVPDQSIKRIIGQYLTNMNIQFLVNNKLETIFFPTCNVSLKKSALDKYRFDASFPLPGGEDLEYFWRLYKNGCRFIYDAGIIVHHYRSPTLKSFIKQNYFYGRGNLLVFKNHPDHPALNNLTLKPWAFLAHTFSSILNHYEHEYWHEVSQKIISHYKLIGNWNKFKVDFFLSVSRLFYLLGKIKQFFVIKFDSEYK